MVGLVSHVGVPLHPPHCWARSGDPTSLDKHIYDNYTILSDACALKDSKKEARYRKKNLHPGLGRLLRERPASGVFIYAILG